MRQSASGDADTRSAHRQRRVLPRPQLWRALARPAAWPALAGLGLGLLALGPGLASGFILSYDMVFVPSPPISAVTFGLTGGPPRAVPSDAVVAVLSMAIPADIVQKMILILIFVLSCSGAAALLASGPWPAGRSGQDAPPAVARLAAGVCYAWNPFVAERLIIGQWALLLGYAALPWVLRSVCATDGPIRLRRVCAVLIPAAIGGFAAMGISALAAVPAAVAGGRHRARARRLATVLTALGILSLPWLIPALLVAVRTDPSGVTAFAARADTPFGRMGSLLMLGGNWNAQTVPAGYGGAPAAGWLLVVLVAITGYILIARPRRLCPGLGIGAVAGLAVAAIGVTGPSRAALRDLIAIWPGFAVVRDGQQFVAPLALAEATGLGAVVWWVTGELKAAAKTAPVSGRGARSARATAVRATAVRATAVRATPVRATAVRATAVRATSVLGVLAVLAPVLLLPGLAWGAAGRLHSVQYPADWLRARQIVDESTLDGTVVLLPWAAYRRLGWNGGEAMLDPWPRLLHRQVIWNDALRVGDQSVAAENPAALRLDAIISSAGPMTSALRAAGVRYVIVDAGPLLRYRGPCLAAAARLPAATVILASGDLVLYQLTAPAAPAAPARANHALTGRQQKVTIRHSSGEMAGSRPSLGTCPGLSVPSVPLPTPARPGIRAKEDRRDNSRNHRGDDHRRGCAGRYGDLWDKRASVQQLAASHEPAVIQLRLAVSLVRIASARHGQDDGKEEPKPAS